ncbi:MAG: gliding motility-associated C-terminal domain-containing protein [Cyclobacteriaceae bacterium]|nr:gliding motility-associated C-terminal domain-containing protein [Cyclobacteriaceae bacterium]
MRRQYFLIFYFVLGFALLSSWSSIAQPTVSIQNVKNACDGLANGSFEILVTAANNPPLEVNVFGPPNQGPFALTVGVPFMVSNLLGSPGGRSYVIIVQDADGSTVLNETIFTTPVNLAASVGSSAVNTNCVTPDGSINISVSGGSGAYSFQWSGPAGFVDPGTEDLSGLSAGSYSLIVSDLNTNCTRSVGPVNITDPSPTPFTVSTVTPSVCLGDGGTVNLDGSEGAAVMYQIYKDGIPTGITQAGTGGPLSFAIPSGLLTPTDAYTFTIEAINGSCAPLFMNGNGIITVNPLPTISLSANPSVCEGTTSGSLAYTSTTNVPDQYRIDWDAAAETAGMVDVALNALPASPIPITGIPLATGTYNATLYVKISGTNCESAGDPISVTVDALPTITIGANPEVCTGTTVSSLTYSSTTGAPDQYRIDWDAVAETAGMVDVALGALPVSPIPITSIPVAAGTYNGILYVTTSGTTCESVGVAISITVNDLPTITLGANHNVCSGVTNSSLAYSATTGADQYRIDWDAAAEAAGMVDVTLSALPVSPISIIGIPMAPGTYNGTLYVKTIGTTCESTGNAISINVEDLPTITLGANPEVCTGTTNSTLTYSATTGAPDQYRIDWDAAAETAGMVDVALSVLPVSPISITGIPVAAGTYNGTLYVTTSGTTCESVGDAISVTVTGLPTITLGAIPAVCLGITSADLAYSATTNSPDQFRIDWDVAAETAGLVDVVATALPATPIVINNVPNAIGTYNGILYVMNDGLTCESSGNPISVTVIALPTITLGAGPVVCAGVTSSSISYSAITGGPNRFRIDWDAAAEGAGLTDVAATALPGTPIPINNIPLAGGTYSGDLFVINSGTGCESSANPISVTVQAVTATLSGDATKCGGSATTLIVNFTGPGPTWNFTYSDGFSNTNLLANSNPFTFSVNPIISTTYSLVDVTGVTCGAGTVSGSATITVRPIAGNPSTFGSETWLAYVYDDSGNPAPPVTNVNFNNTKYRGFLDATEIASISGFSSYDVTTDAFNLNLTNTIPVAGANVCGSYLNDYSIRFRMTKTFAAGIYTFTLGADDGVRLWVDGVSILPAGSFSTHSFVTYNSTPVCLTAGTHNLVIEYFDRGGFSKITFDYSESPAPTVSTPVSLCVNSMAPTLNASSAGAIGYNWYTDATLTNPPIFTGANYTPAPTQLDMTTVGTADFYVTAVYACGETPAAHVTVDVTSGANIVLPPTPVQVCDVGGIIDLNTLVSAAPAGGTFTFSGPPSVTDPNFDPSGLGNTTVTINVDYTSGTCMASASFDIDVVTNATITVPATTSVCESGGIIDLTALVGGNPGGGTFTFSGPGVGGAGFDFDPSGLSGSTTITVDYIIGGCNAPTQTFDVDVTPNVALLVDNSTTVCPSSGPVDLSTLISPSPAGGAFTFTGTGVTGTQFDPTGSAGSTVLINVSYDIGGCHAASTVQIVVRSATDPLCGGPTGNCATVSITPMPTAAICSPTDGSILFNINPAVPTINNTGVRIDIVGTSTTNLGVSQTNFNDPLFTGLSVGTYNYTIEYGDPGCIKTGQVTVLLGPDVVDFTVAPNSVNCFGSSGGVVLSGINGSDLADYSYEITQLGSIVTTGSITQLQSVGEVTLTGFGSGDFEIKLSQDQSATTTCSSPVQSARKPFTITSPAANLDTLYVNKKISVPDLPTGSMTVGISESLQEPYEVRLELTQPLFPGQVFAQDFTEATRNSLNLKVEFEALNLFAGGYLLSIRDSLGCQKNYPITIGVDNNLLVPNIFTPNGDGVNEVFYIRNMPDATEVIISNRWGKQVYSSKNYQNDWDGGDAVDGVYYYRINAAGKSYSGWVEVLRGN